MAEYKQKQTTPQKQEETAEVEAKSEVNEELSLDVEDILDEIDEVLEENAEEFVNGFVQKGGEAVVCPERGNALSALKKFLKSVVGALTFPGVAVA